MSRSPICILATLDRNYIPCFCVMLHSLLYSNPGEQFAVYLLHDALLPDDVQPVERQLAGRGTLDELAAHLYEKETITGSEFMEILKRKEGAQE